MPEKEQKEPIAECANLDCEVQIYEDTVHWKYGHLKYCSGKCLSDSMKITAE